MKYKFNKYYTKYNEVERFNEGIIAHQSLYF